MSLLITHFCHFQEGSDLGRMALSIPNNMTNPMDRSFPIDRLPISPPTIGSYFPSLFPHGHYLGILANPHDMFNPLKSLGRLVNKSSPLGTFNFRDLPPVFTQSSPQSQNMFSSLPTSYPIFSKVQPELCSKKDPQTNGQLEGHRIPSTPLESPRVNKKCKGVSLSMASLEGPPSRTYQFTEDDLHTVLYGHTCGTETKRAQHSATHAISGLRIPASSTGQYRSLNTFLQIPLSNVNYTFCMKPDHTPYNLHLSSIRDSGWDTY